MSVSIGIDNVVKKYGDTTIIPDLSAFIKNGEFFTLLGPSGCGKTTLLRMIAGFNSIEGGTIKFDDKVINDIPAQKRNIGMVFQSYAIFPHLTVRQNVEYGLKIRKVPKEHMKERVDEILKVVKIDEYQDRLPERLSGGQQQRVALARAIVIHPQVLLMDEPLSNLDAKLRTQMRTEIIKLHQKLDTTFVYVTHDQTEAMTMGDRIVVMKGGEIQQADTPQTLYDHPCNLFVAGFIGSPQMNFMDAELGRDADGYKLTFADQSLHFAGSDALSEYVGKTVVFGIRPENLHTSGEKFTQNAAHTLTMHVDIAELMGAEIYAHCTCDGTSVTVRTPSGEPIHAGDTITAAVDMSRIHLFDKQTERAIAF